MVLFSKLDASWLRWFLLLFVVAGCSDKPKRVSYSGDIETCNLMCQPQQPLGEMPISEAQTTDGWKFWR